jgi:hypothetical protein
MLLVFLKNSNVQVKISLNTISSCFTHCLHAKAETLFRTVRTDDAVWYSFFQYFSHMYLVFEEIKASLNTASNEFYNIHQHLIFSVEIESNKNTEHNA